MVWIALLAMADRDGFVRASRTGLARRANVTEEGCRAALKVLMAPDPESASQVQAGRRIEVIRGGWLVINYKEHRDLHDTDMRRAQVREAVRRHRAAVKSPVIMSNPEKAHTEAEAEGEAEAERDKGIRASPVAVASAGPAKVPKTTWLTRYAELWRVRFGGLMPMGQAARYLKPLEAEHGQELTLKALGVFLDEHAGREARYLSLAKFAETFGVWRDGGRRRTQQDRNEAAIDAWAEAQKGDDDGE